MSSTLWPCPWNSSESVESGDVQLYRHVAYCINGVITAITVIVGFITNLLSIWVLEPCNKRRPKIYTYLIVLGVWDIALLINAFMMYGVPTLWYGKVVSYGSRYVHTYMVWYTISNMTLFAGVWLIMALTVDRYLAACHPLRHQLLISSNRGWLLNRFLAGVSVGAIVMGLPRMFELQVVECLAADGDMPGVLVRPSPLYMNQWYHYIYKIAGGILLYSIVPYALVLGLTVCISVELRRARINRDKMTLVKCLQVHASQFARHSKALIGSKPPVQVKPLESRTSSMLIAVIVKFLLSHLMPTAMDVSEAILGREKFGNSVIASISVDLSNYLVVLNSATNFIVYLCWGRTFRKHVFALVKTWFDYFGYASRSPIGLTPLSPTAGASTLQRNGKRKGPTRWDSIVTVASTSNNNMTSGGPVHITGFPSIHLAPKLRNNLLKFKRYLQNNIAYIVIFTLLDHGLIYFFDFNAHHCHFVSWSASSMDSGESAAEDTLPGRSVSSITRYFRRYPNRTAVNRMLHARSNPTICVQMIEDADDSASLADDDKSVVKEAQQRTEDGGSGVRRLIHDQLSFISYIDSSQRSCRSTEADVDKLNWSSLASMHSDPIHTCSNTFGATHKLTKAKSCDSIFVNSRGTVFVCDMTSSIYF